MPNMYNAGANDCSGGVAGVFQYCSLADHSCDDGTNLNGAGSSEASSSCYSMNSNPVGGFAGRKNWRVPTISELSTFKDNVYLNHMDLFPQTVTAADYASSSSYDAANFWSLKFGKSYVPYNNSNKLARLPVRCVSSGK